MPSFDVSMRMNALACACAQLMPALRESARSILHGRGLQVLAVVIMIISYILCIHTVIPVKTPKKAILCVGSFSGL